MKLIYEIAFKCMYILILILIFTFIQKILFQTVNTKIKKLEDDSKNINSRTQINFLYFFRSISKYFIWIIFFVFITNILHLEFLLQFLAFASVILGLVIKEFMLDFLSGFIILIEKQFCIGDTITVDNDTGVVKEIKIRTTILELKDGRELILSNHLLTKVIVNKKKL